MDVVVAARREEKLQQVAAEIERGGVRALPVVCDVRHDDDVQRLIDTTVDAFGRLDVLFANAGYGIFGSVLDTSDQQMRDIFETNFFGVLRVCRAVVPLLRAQESGLIVNVSSLGGLVTIPFQGFYSASKYALESMSDAMRMELRPFGVNVVLLEPGDFKTGFTENRIFAAEAGDGSVYQESCQRAVAVMEHDEQNGADPKQLAELLEKIISSPAPGNRYPVGALGQRWAVAARRFIPSALMDRALRAIYKV